MDLSNRIKLAKQILEELAELRLEIQEQELEKARLESEKQYFLCRAVISEMESLEQKLTHKIASLETHEYVRNARWSRRSLK